MIFYQKITNKIKIQDNLGRVGVHINYILQKKKKEKKTINLIECGKHFVVFLIGKYTQKMESFTMTNITIYIKKAYISKITVTKKKKMSYINSLFEIINVIQIKKSDTNKMKHYLSSFNYNIAKNCFFLNLC